MIRVESSVYITRCPRRLGGKKKCYPFSQVIKGMQIYTNSLTVFQLAIFKNLCKLLLSLWARKNLIV